MSRLLKRPFGKTSKAPAPEAPAPAASGAGRLGKFISGATGRRAGRGAAGAGAGSGSGSSDVIRASPASALPQSSMRVLPPVGARGAEAPQKRGGSDARAAELRRKADIMARANAQLDRVKIAQLQRAIQEEHKKQHPDGVGAGGARGGMARGGGGVIARDPEMPSSSSVRAAQAMEKMRAGAAASAAKASAAKASAAPSAPKVGGLIIRRRPAAGK